MNLLSLLGVDDFTPTTLCSTCQKFFGYQATFNVDILEIQDPCHPGFTLTHSRSLYQLAEHAATGCSFCAWIDAYYRRPGCAVQQGEVKFNIKVRREDYGFICELDLYVGDDRKHSAFRLLPFAVCRRVLKSPGAQRPQGAAGYTRSPECRETAKAWLGDCARSHKACKPPSVDEYRCPTRLLECTFPLTEDALVRLRTNFAPKARPLYVVLSHCWGNSPMYTLREDTRRALEDGVPLSELAKTFREAFEVCSWVECQYLWIDSLCIQQDSPEDWARESYLMTEVYSNAALTIAAADASNSAEGLFRVRNPASIVVPRINLNRSGAIKGQYCLVDAWLWREIEASKLAGRAWAVQERLLSRRVLHFGHRQMYFECNLKRCCESFPGGPSPVGVGSPLKKLTQADVSPEEAWSFAIETYSQARLTKVTDKYIAVAGIAKKIQQATGDDYLAGLWKRDLPRQLCWSSGDNVTRRPETPRWPSWSWLATDEGVSLDINVQGWHSKIVLKAIPLIEVDGVCVTPKSPERPLGDVKSAAINIRGKLRKAVWHEDQVSFKDPPTHPLDSQGDEWSSKLHHRPDFLLSNTEKQADIFTLPVLLEQYSELDVAIRGLTLKRSGKRRDEYVRIGSFYCNMGIGVHTLLEPTARKSAKSTDQPHTQRQTSTVVRSLRPFNSEESNMLRRSIIRTWLSPMLNSWVVSRRVTQLIADEEGTEEAEVPSAFLGHQPEAEMAAEAERDAVEEWRVYQAFRQIGVNSPYPASREVIQSRTIRLV